MTVVGMILMSRMVTTTDRICVIEWHVVTKETRIHACV